MLSSHHVSIHNHTRLAARGSESPKKGCYQTQRQTFYKAQFPSASCKRPAQNIIWRGARYYAMQDRSLHTCGCLYTRHPFCCLPWLFCLQKVCGRWSMSCTSSAGLLGWVVTLTVSLTSDPGWATHQKAFRFHMASGFVVSSFRNSQSTVAVVWGGTNAELSQCESKHLLGTVYQAVDPLPAEWEEKPICRPDEGKLKSLGLDMGRKLFGWETDLILWGNQKPAD